MNRQALLEVLSAVRPGLPGAGASDQQMAFLFSPGRVATYNGEIGVSCPMPGLDVKASVKAEELYALLGKTDCDDIDIAVDNNEIRLMATNIKAGISLVHSCEEPFSKDKAIGSWASLPDSFMAAAKFVLFSCAKDLVRPALSCVHFNKDGFAESSDNLRVTRFNMGKGKKARMPIESFLLPGSTVQELTKYPAINEAAREAKTGWVHFRDRDKDLVFSCRIFNGKYPDASEVYKMTGRQLDLPESLSSALGRATVFSRDKTCTDYMIEQVSIGISKEAIVISARNSYGWFEESIDSKHSGESVSFAINPHFLEDMLSKLKSCTLGQDRIKFEGDNWMHVAALMVVQQDKKVPTGSK